jgi:hypothetical protein
VGAQTTALPPQDSGTNSDSAVPPGDGAACVEINPSSFNVSCTSASDCIAVQVGQVCSGTCDCGGTGAISASDQAKYTAAIVPVQFDETCPCLPLPPPICLSGVCTRCDLSSSEPAACRNGGVEDAGPSDGASGATQCVTIPDLYGGCNVDSDCTSVASGTLCSGQCNCPDLPVNVSVLPTYDALISPLHFAAGPCSCPAESVPRCVKGSCSF